MHYISDYIDFYKDSDLEQVRWNIMDNLICAILVYLPIDGFEERKSLTQLLTYAKKYKTKEDVGNMIPMAYEVLEKLEGSLRYQDMQVFNFENDRNNRTQFGAMTVRIGKLTIVSYKGTDHSIIGWMENFRISYEYPTYTHRLGIDYLKKVINPFRDRQIYVTGHSKGGNLAMVSAMEMEGILFKNIKKVYNFDGPGFRKDEYKSAKYKRLSKKLVNVIPEGSIVGMLMYNKDYQVVKTAPISINDHYPDTWRIFGEFFVPGTISGLSTRLHNNLIESTEKFTYAEIKEAFEVIFKSIEQEHTSDLDISPETIFSLLKNMKDVDKEILGNIYEIMKKLI